MRIPFLFALLVLTVACSGPKKVADNGKAETEVSQTSVLSKDSIFLSFERTLCFGECPAYIVTVYPDGRAIYKGKKFVDRIGSYTTNLTTKLAADIKREAERVNFFNLQDKYDASVSDVPSTITILSGPDGLKRVINRFNGPEELKSFEKYLDSLLLNLDWVEK